MIDDLRSACDIAAAAARRAAQAVFETGGDARLVLSDMRRDVKVGADHMLEKSITGSLAESSPYPILSEENADSHSMAGTGYYWIVDPLDGSVNFSRGIAMHCISIALWHGETPLTGVVYDFSRGELFQGIAGEGAWLNEVPVRVGNVERESEAILCTGFPVGTDFSKEAVERFSNNIRIYKKVRLFGSAALSLAYVACGRADVYMEENIKIWDVAAGLALVKAAGGEISFARIPGSLKCRVRACNAPLMNYGYSG